uniref:C2H2-type domain-containing protein n=1 Tax=Timema genevievae TaxID=629358 RepID=A0A7R9JZ76_TIMGE|nr:unnamed protein product [Timema genevievae]
MQADVVKRDYLGFVSKQEVIDYLKQFTSSGHQLDKFFMNIFSRCMTQDLGEDEYCDAKISADSGSGKNAPTRASNLKRDLQRIHPEVFKAVNEKDYTISKQLMSNNSRQAKDQKPQTSFTNPFHQIMLDNEQLTKGIYAIFEVAFRMNGLQKCQEEEEADVMSSASSTEDELEFEKYLDFKENAKRSRMKKDSSKLIESKCVFAISKRKSLIVVEKVELLNNVDSGMRKKDIEVHCRHQHRETKHYNCDQCPRHFFNKTGLAAHQRSHTDKKPFCCAKCKKTFFFKSALERHLRVYTGEKPYPCDYCGRSFIDKKAKLQHHQIHKKENYKTHEYPVTCEWAWRTGFDHGRGCGGPQGDKPNLEKASNTVSKITLPSLDLVLATRPAHLSVLAPLVVALDPDVFLALQAVASAHDKMTSPDLAGANYRPLYVASQSSGEDLKIKTPNPLGRAVHPIIDLHAEFPRDGETSTCPTTSPAKWKVTTPL